MRILVYPHDLAIGGSQINAIDLAAAVASHGHDVIIYGIPGPLVSYVDERGLRFVPARPLRYRPAPSRISQLAMIAKQERLDLIHAYEWPPCLDAYFGAHLVLGVPLVCTVLGMSIMPCVPTSVPLVMGTEALGLEARKVQRGPVWVLEPPIDTSKDHPEIDGSEFRRAHGVRPEDFVIVSVSRLAVDLKLDSLVRAIDAANLLADRYPVRLLIVGDGRAANALSERAKAVNERWGRSVVVLTGALLDPRIAYAAADLVVAMGSSALRALSIGRPVIVQGEDAFSEVFDSASQHIFLRQGFYGHHDNAIGAHRLAVQISELIDDPGRRRRLGCLGRQVVTERFSLERAARVQLAIYEEVVRTRNGKNLADVIRVAARAMMVEIKNHSPALKAEARKRERRLLSAARGGIWPPAHE